MKELYVSNGNEQGNNIPCDTCENKGVCLSKDYEKCKELYDYMIENKELKVC